MVEGSAVRTCGSDGCGARALREYAGFWMCDPHRTGLITELWRGRPFPERASCGVRVEERVSYVDRVVYVDREIPVPVASPAPTSSLVYYATWDDGPVKVGTTANPRSRFKNHRREHAGFVVLAAEPGSYVEESVAHKALKPYALARETFEDRPEVQAHMDRVRSEHPQWRSIVDGVADARSGRMRKRLASVSGLYCIPVDPEPTVLPVQVSVLPTVDVSPKSFPGGAYGPDCPCGSGDKAYRCLDCL